MWLSAVLVLLAMLLLYLIYFNLQEGGQSERQLIYVIFIPYIFSLIDDSLQLSRNANLQEITAILEARLEAAR